MNLLERIWREEDGVLSFEWTIIAVVIVFGITVGLSAARDVLIDELGDMAAAVISFDQSYSFAGLPALGIPASTYTDNPGEVVDCGRQTTIIGIDGLDDAAGGELP